MPTALIVGATRGLGYQLAEQYAQKNGYSVTGTARSGPPKETHSNISWISGVDIATEGAGQTIVDGLKGVKQNVTIITAGFFIKESMVNCSGITVMCATANFFTGMYRKSFLLACTCLRCVEAFSPSIQSSSEIAL